MKKKLIILSLLVCPTLLSLGACGSPTEVLDGFKGVFIPKADLFVTDIKSADLLKGVSILQSFVANPSTGGSSVQYKFNEPTVTIVNRPGLPRVIFKQMIVQYSIGDKQLSSARVPTTVTVPNGGQFSGPIPILSSTAEELIAAMYPNNSPTDLRTGTADVTLLGVDDSNNLITVKFNTPVRFESDLAGLTAPSAAPSASASPN